MSAAYKKDKEEEISGGQKLSHAALSSVRLQRLQIILGCFFVALSVSCRQSAVFVSFLVPVILFPLVRKQGRKKIITTVLCAVIPYLVVALPLMWYNYARFDSIMEFGTGLVLTGYNNQVITDLNPAGNAMLVLQALRNLFFTPFQFSATFPFIHNAGTLVFDAAMPQRYYNGQAGLINFPVFWALVFSPVLFKQLRKKEPIPRKGLLSLNIAMLSVGMFTAVAIYFMVGMSVRYQIDYMFLFVFTALICGYLAWERFGRSANVCKVMCVGYLLSAAIAIPLPPGNAPFWNLPPEIYAGLQEVFTLF